MKPVPIRREAVAAAPLIDPEAAVRVFARWAREDQEQRGRDAARGIMAPERAAAVERALKGHVADDPAARERLRRAYTSAMGDYALMVAQGTIPAGSAAWLSAVAAGFGPEPPREVLAYFRHLVARGLADWERAMDEAEREVCYHIAHLFDAIASPEEIERAALSVSYPLTPGQVAWIIRREKAWWLRLNVVLHEAEVMADAA